MEEAELQSSERDIMINEQTLAGVELYVNFLGICECIFETLPQLVLQLCIITIDCYNNNGNKNISSYIICRRSMTLSNE